MFNTVPVPLGAVVSLQVDLGVDHRHEEGGQDEGDGEERDGGQGGEGRLWVVGVTPGPEVRVRLVETAGQTTHQTSHQPDTAQAQVGPEQSLCHLTFQFFNLDCLQQ